MEYKTKIILWCEGAANSQSRVGLVFGLSRTNKLSGLGELLLTLRFFFCCLLFTMVSIPIRVVPMAQLYVSGFFGISAFLKGFISWLQRYQYTNGGGHHQIMTHPFPWNLNVTITLSGSTAVCGANGAIPFRAASAWTSDRLSSIKMKTLKRILRETGIVTTDDYCPPRSKGTQESFRRGPRERAETPKQWNRGSAFKVHPYFSDNLKYVK
jgi:hypothetical protein